MLQYASVDNDGTDLFFAFCPKLLRLSLDALTKTQSNDVRLNCVGLFLNSFWVFFVCLFQLCECHCHLLSSNSSIMLL